MEASHNKRYVEKLKTKTKPSCILFFLEILCQRLAVDTKIPLNHWPFLWETVVGVASRGDLVSPDSRPAAARPIRCSCFTSGRKAKVSGAARKTDEVFILYGKQRQLYECMGLKHTHKRTARTHRYV